jgi:uncharacterized membrane protein YoaK (UPF0700 family)
MGWLKTTGLSTAFCFAVGMADCVSFREYGAFAGLMTGNFIQMCSCLIEDGWVKHEDLLQPKFLFHFSVIAAFVVGSFAYTICVEKFTTSSRLVASFVLLVIVCHQVVEYNEMSAWPEKWQVCGVSFLIGFMDTFAIASDIKRVPYLQTIGMSNITSSLANMSMFGRRALDHDERLRDIGGFCNLIGFLGGACTSSLLRQVPSINRQQLLITVCIILCGVSLANGPTLPQRKKNLAFLLTRQISPAGPNTEMPDQVTRAATTVL